MGRYALVSLSPDLLIIKPNETGSLWKYPKCKIGQTTFLLQTPQILHWRDRLSPSQRKIGDMLAPSRRVYASTAALSPFLLCFAFALGYTGVTTLSQDPQSPALPSGFTTRSSTFSHAGPPKKPVFLHCRSCSAANGPAHQRLSSLVQYRPGLTKHLPLDRSLRLGQRAHICHTESILERPRISCRWRS
jgi:hypothetical protein